jgi:integrase
MAIQYLSRTKAKLIVSTGSASRGNRRRWTRIVTITGKKDAERQLRAFELECASSSMTADTVGDLLDAYIDMQRIKGIKETTLTGYESYAKRLKLAFKGIGARDLTPYQIEKFIALAVKGEPKKGYPKKASPKTIKGYISLLSSAYKMAIRNKMLTVNPCDAVIIPKQKKPEITVLTKDEVNAFVDALEDTTLDLRVVYELALFCGLRRSEIMGLMNNDVNVLWRTIKVQRTRHRIHCEDIIQDMKTEQSRAVVSVPEFVMYDIVRLMKEHEEDPYIENPFLIQYASEPMRPDYAKRQIKEFTKSHGLPDVTLHGLRHTFASMLNASGEFDIAEISAALRHSSIGTTLNIYTHLFESATKSSRRISDFMQKGHSEGTPDNEKTAESL